MLENAFWVRVRVTHFTPHLQGKAHALIIQEVGYNVAVKNNLAC